MSMSDESTVDGHLEQRFQALGRFGRLITPQEVAEAVLFLCSPGASAITGTTLTVAGGEI